MMKINNIGLLALSVALTTSVTSCHKDTPEQQTGKYPILFSSQCVTKAESTITDIQENGFKVYAYFEANNNKFNFDKEVFYDETQNVWAYDGLEYWIPSSSYWFKAIYPKDGFTYAVDNTTQSQSLSITDFDVTKQIDLLEATATAEVPADSDAPATGSVVNLTFKHLLACVDIKIKAEIAGVKVESVTLDNVAQSGDFSNNTWTSDATAVVTKDNLNKSLDKNSQDYEDVTGGGFFVIPEAVGTQSFIIKTNEKEYDPITIPNENPTKWETNTKYTYTLTIKQDNIVFNTPTVQIWDEENATGSVIIK